MEARWRTGRALFRNDLKILYAQAITECSNISWAIGFNGRTIARHSDIKKQIGSEWNKDACEAMEEKTSSQPYAKAKQENKSGMNYNDSTEWKDFEQGCANASGGCLFIVLFLVVLVCFVGCMSA